MSKCNFIIIRDTQEKKGWGDFPSRVEDHSLKTGDYSIKGYEEVITIERKGSVAEFAQNLFHKQKQFKNELRRMKSFKYSYVILEFNFDDMWGFPYNDPILMRKSGGNIRVTGKLLLKRLNELQIEFPHVHFLFAGKKRGKDIAISLFKRFMEIHGQENVEAE